MDNESKKREQGLDEHKGETSDSADKHAAEPALNGEAQLHTNSVDGDNADGLEPSSLSNEPASQTVKKPVVKNEAWEWAKALLIALGLVFVIRWFIFAPFIVDGESMEPNFDNAERIIVNKILYNVREPKRGEVVVFHAPAEKDYIKRVIALPGETVRVQGDKVYVNGELLDEPYLKEAMDKAHQAGGNYNNRNYAEAKVPEGSIFVMGDNRSFSSDSRMIGPVELEKIVGRADLIFWPANKIHWIH
ncbi:MAG: signal peptidase [Paenibacillus sp.]|jgi:signal peptidase I|nr:signal peptidase [Paenibacillus sp.]